MDGLTLSEALREVPHARKMPVILLSPDGLEGVDPARRQVGFFSVIPKPWKSSTLLRELLRMLGPDIPLASGSNPATPEEIQHPVIEENPYRILVVEDNPVNQQVVVTVLRALGFQPDVAENGRQGIEKAEMGRYDLILLDVQMPDIDGLSMARHVREFVNDPRPVIVAITAGVSPEERQACFDAGMDDFVMKPFKIATLKEAVLRYARPGEPAAA